MVNDGIVSVSNQHFGWHSVLVMTDEQAGALSWLKQHTKRHSEGGSHWNICQSSQSV